MILEVAFSMFLRICDNALRIEMQEHNMVDEATTIIMSGLIHWGALLREPYGFKGTALSSDHGVDAVSYFKSYSEERSRLRNKNLHLRHGRKREPRSFCRIIKYWVCSSGRPRLDMIEYTSKPVSVCLK